MRQAWNVLSCTDVKRSSACLCSSAACRFCFTSSSWRRVSLSVSCSSRFCSLLFCWLMCSRMLRRSTFLSMPSTCSWRESSAASLSRVVWRLLHRKSRSFCWRSSSCSSLCRRNHSCCFCSLCRLSSTCRSLVSASLRLSFSLCSWALFICLRGLVGAGAGCLSSCGMLVSVSWFIIYIMRCGCKGRVFFCYLLIIP